MEFEFGIECKPLKPFPVIRETLERCGIPNHRNKELFPSCYILHKKERYYIIHFKNLLKLDGKYVDNFSDQDAAREASIAMLLEDWGLIEIVDRKKVEEIERQYIFVLKSEDRGIYEIVHKYSIGNKGKGEAA